MQSCNSLGSGSCPTGPPVAESFQSDGIPAVFPVSSAIKATAGRYCTFEVQTQIPFIEDTTAQAPGVSFTAQPPEMSGWSTSLGLGLYVLSTLLLSVQATSAKVLGEYPLCLECWKSKAPRPKLLLFREAWYQHFCNDPFQKFFDSAGSSPTSLVPQAGEPLGYQVRTSMTPSFDESYSYLILSLTAQPVKVC